MRTIIFPITFILSLFEETLYGYLLQHNIRINMFQFQNEEDIIYIDWGVAFAVV